MADPEIIPPQATAPKRPIDFTDEIFDAICERMTEGEGLRKICTDPDMPSRQTFLRWMEKDSGRQARYTAAREALMDWYAEEILDIAWDSSKDTIPATKTKPARCDNEWVARSRLKVDTLKFLMAKLHPKRYGDRLPETVEQKSHEASLLELEETKFKVRWQGGDGATVGDLMRTIDGRTRGLDREIIAPIHDDDGNIINASNASALRARIIQLEERLGMREGPPQPPKQLTYDPGPLPARIDPEILARFLRMIKTNVPHADQRSPETVLDEVLSECESALKAKYGDNPV